MYLMCPLEFFCSDLSIVTSWLATCKLLSCIILTGRIRDIMMQLQGKYSFNIIAIVVNF